MASFLVRNTLVIETRKIFGLVGDVVDGDLNKGMIIITGDENTGNLIIDSIQGIRSDSGILVLIVKYDSREELEKLKNLRTGIFSII
jgi:hypothetical protein